jgi:peptidyl-prolyl cis-trans isomerase SurA
VLSYINQQRASGISVPQDSAGQMAFAREALNQLIDEEILVQKAHEMKVDVTEGEVNRAVDDQLKRVRDQFKTEEEYRTELKNAGFGTPEEYRRTLYTQFYRRSLQQRVFPDLQKTARMKNVSDAEIDEAFQKNRDLLKNQPATVTFRQIVVAPKPTAEQKKTALAKAESLLVEIRKGGDFEQIAKRESMDPGTRQLGGDLGWNRRGSGLVPEFEQMMFALRPGEVSPVIETSFGYHIIRVDRVQAAEVKARHILIAPVIDSADVAAAKVEADSVAAQWRRGVAYDSLVAKHHDPTEEKGVLQPFPRDSLPASYIAALAGAKPGDITQPFQLANPRGQPKYGVLQVVTATDAGEYKESEIRDQIRAQLSEERSIRALLDDMRKQTYVSIRM